MLHSEVEMQWQSKNCRLKLSKQQCKCLALLKISIPELYIPSSLGRHLYINEFVF